MFKLTPQICRLAKQEFEERRADLPADVRDDVSFEKVLQLIALVENSEFAKALELLGEAYKEHEEMMSYFPKRTVVVPVSSTCIYSSIWYPPSSSTATLNMYT